LEFGSILGSRYSRWCWFRWAPACQRKNPVNCHVVTDADPLKVRLSEKRQLEAENVGADLRCGRIRIKDEVPCDLPTARLNNLDALKVDDWALAISALFKSLSRNYQEAGFNVRILLETDTEHTIIQYIADGLGVALLPEQLIGLPHEGVVFRPLSPPLLRGSTIA
jgi:DNA-binding transcriptional LysR family regulator